MTESKVLLKDESHPAAPLQVEWHAVLSVLGILGFVFVIVGGIDAALVWYPTAFGRPEWEFGSVTAGLNGLPLPVLGLLLVLAHALVDGRRMFARAVTVALAVLALGILVIGVVYATDVPIALRAAGTDVNASLGIRKSIVKTALQLISYPIGLGVVSWRSWAMTRRES